MSRLQYSFLALALIAAGATAQTVQPPSGDQRIERLTTHYRFERDGTGERVQSGRVHLLTAAALDTYGQLVFQYAGETERASFTVIDVLRGGVRKASVADAEILEVASAVVAELATYTDAREVHAVVPKLSVGDVLEYEMRATLISSLAPGDFWLDHRWSDEIVEEEILEVELPAEVPIAFEDRTGETRADEVVNGRRLLRWRHAESREAADDETKEEEPGPFAWLKHEEWPEPVLELSSFATWDELASWYAGLQFSQQGGADEPRLRQVVAANSVGGDPVGALFHFVRRQIRYVSLSFGIGRYQPHRATEVLDHAHGDCKDKHTLLASLLNEAGITAYPALVSTFRDPDLDVPTPAQFDHVITAIPEGDGFRFLDATNVGMPMGLLPAPVRGRNALVVTPAGVARWVEVPEQVPFETWSKVTLEGRLEGNGRIRGKGVSTMRGDTEVSMREVLQSAPGDGGWAGMVLTMGFGGKVTSISSNDPLDTREPLVVSFDYQREGTPLRRGAKIDLPSLMAGFSLGPLLAVEGEDLEGILDRNEIEIALELPEGAEIDLPVPVRVERPFAQYTSTYSIEGRTFRARRSLDWKQAEIAAAGREVRQAFVHTVATDGGQGPRVREPARDLAAPDDLDVAQLERSAMQLLARRQGTEALALLERITTAQPDHPRAWLMISSVQLSVGNTDAALEAAQRHLELHPEDGEVYRQIGAVHMFAGRHDEAIAAFQQQLTRSPLDAKTLASLGFALLQTDRVTEAVDALTKAASIDPESPEMNGALASALLRAGRREEALARIRDLEEIENVELLVGLAGETMRVGEIDLSRKLLLRAVDKKPEHPMAWYLLGVLAIGQGDMDTATRNFNRHLELFPGDTKATAMLQMARGDLGADLRSATQIDTLAGSEEGRALAYVGNARLHFRAGRKTEAMASFEQALATSDAATVKAAVAQYLAFYRIDEKRAGVLADAALSELIGAAEALDVSSDASTVDRHLRDLAGTWSTIGAVAFMNLDLAAAKPYLAAGVLWMPRAETAELLGTIEEYEKNVPAAKRYFAIALAAEGTSNTARQDLNRLLGKDESVEGVVRREWAAHRRRLEMRLPKPMMARPVTQALVRLTSGGVIEDVRLLAAASELDSLVAQLKGARFEVEAPERTPSRLVARAEIDCSSEVESCVVRLLAPSARF